MLFGNHLRVTEGIADGEGNTIDRNLDIVGAGEVLTAAVTLNHDAAAFVQTCHGRETQVKLILQQRL